MNDVQKKLKIIYKNYDDIDNSNTNIIFFNICNNENITIYKTNELDENIGGIIQKEGKKGNISIYLNKNNTTSADNIVTAYLLGYYYYYMQDNNNIGFKLYKDNLFENIIFDNEYINLKDFTLELLMPEDKLRKIFCNFNIKYNYISTTITKLSMIFGLGQRYIKFRLKEIGIII